MASVNLGSLISVYHDYVSSKYDSFYNYCVTKKYIINGTLQTIDFNNVPATDTDAVNLQFFTKNGLLDTEKLAEFIHTISKQNSDITEFDAQAKTLVRKLLVQAKQANIPVCLTSEQANDVENFAKIDQIKVPKTGKLTQSSKSKIPAIKYWLWGLGISVILATIIIAPLLSNPTSSLAKGVTLNFGEASNVWLSGLLTGLITLLVSTPVITYGLDFAVKKYYKNKTYNVDNINDLVATIEQSLGTENYFTNKFNRNRIWGLENAYLDLYSRKRLNSKQEIVKQKLEDSLAELQQLTTQNYILNYDSQKQFRYSDIFAKAGKHLSKEDIKKQAKANLNDELFSSILILVSDGVTPDANVVEETAEPSLIEGVYQRKQNPIAEIVADGNDEQAETLIDETAQNLIESKKPKNKDESKLTTSYLAIYHESVVGFLYTNIKDWEMVYKTLKTSEGVAVSTLCDFSDFKKLCGKIISGQKTFTNQVNKAIFLSFSNTYKELKIDNLEKANGEDLPL